MTQNGKGHHPRDPHRRECTPQEYRDRWAATFGGRDKKQREKRQRQAKEADDVEIQRGQGQQLASSLDAEIPATSRRGDVSRSRRA